MASDNNTILWHPDPAHMETTNLVNFAKATATKYRPDGSPNQDDDWQEEYQRLWQWSVDESPAFWDALWDWHGIVGEKGDRLIAKAI